MVKVQFTIHICMAAVALMFCAMVPTNSFAATLKIGGTGSALGAIRILADEFRRLNPNILVEIPQSLGSSGGIKAVLAGVLNIGLSSRKLKPKERGAGAQMIRYAATPFILATRISPSNATPGLSSEEIVKAFSADPLFWKDGSAVRIILRNEKDTSTKLLISAFEGMDVALAKARSVQGIPVAFTEQDNMDLAEVLPGPLTTGSLTAILSERRNLTPVSIDGIAPTLENLASGAHKISRSFYMVTGPSPGDAAQAFIDFVQSADGAEILEKTGNLPIGRQRSTE